MARRSPKSRRSPLLRIASSWTVILPTSGSGVWLGSSLEVMPRNPNASVANIRAPELNRRSMAAHVNISERAERMGSAQIAALSSGLHDSLLEDTASNHQSRLSGRLSRDRLAFVLDDAGLP